MHKKICLALIGIAMIASPALSWSRDMTQPANKEVAIWAYPEKSANYCPAGLQPIVLGGVVCCGQPTHTGYQSHPPRRAYTPRVVSYGKGIDDTVVVYEKGQ